MVCRPMQGYMVDVPHSLLFHKISEVRSYRLQCTLGNITLRCVCVCVCVFSCEGGVGVAQSLWFPGPLVPWSSGPLVLWCLAAALGRLQVL